MYWLSVRVLGKNLVNVERRNLNYRTGNHDRSACLCAVGFQFFLDRGFMVSFSGIATFRAGDNVRESARYVPDDRILVETDSPFLAPVPMRGKRCESAFVVHTARRIAEERNTDFERFAEITYSNSVRLFGE